MTQQEAIRTLLESTDARSRRLAAEELAQNFNEQTVIIDAFVEGLTDPDKGTRDACAQGILARIEEFTAYKAERVAGLITHKNIAFRNLAGDILLKLGLAGARALMPWLRDNDPDNQKFACDIIGLVGNEEVIPGVMELLDSEDGNARAAGIEALGNLNAAEALQTLIDSYSNDEELRPHIIEAVGKIGGEIAQDFLLERITDDDEFTQIAAIDSLAESATDIAIAYKLLEILPDATKQIQIILLKTIMSISFRLESPIEIPDEHRSIAHNALFDDEPDARIAGLLALGDTYYQEDVPALLAEIGKRDPETRQQILEVLLASSSEASVADFFDQLPEVLAADLEYMLDILGKVYEIWEDLRPEIQAIISDSLHENIAALDSIHREILEFLASAALPRAVDLISTDLQSDDTERIDNALALVRQYRLEELRPLIEKLAKSNSAAAPTATEFLRNSDTQMDEFL